MKKKLLSLSSECDTKKGGKMKKIFLSLLSECGTKKIFIPLSTLGVISTLTISAMANPFTDVKTNHWAYSSLDKLTKEGVLKGYPDGKFKGNASMTRYEIAQVVAKAMAVEEQADAKVSVENKALIDRLAKEFGSELKNLGVRVSSLEDRVGNIKFTGDGTLRYKGSKINSINADPNIIGTVTGNNPIKLENKNTYQVRFRVNASATLHKYLKANVRLTTWGNDIQEQENLVDGSWGRYNSWANLANNSGSATEVRFDRYNVVFDNGNLLASIGKDNAELGEGLFIGSESGIDKSLLGEQVKYSFGGKNTKVSFKFMHGRLDPHEKGYHNQYKDTSVTVEGRLTAFDLEAKFGVSKKHSFGIGAYVGQIAPIGDEIEPQTYFLLGNKPKQIYGFNLSYTFNQKYKIWYEHLKSPFDVYVLTGSNVLNNSNNTAYAFGLDLRPTNRWKIDLNWGKFGSLGCWNGLSKFGDGLLLLNGIYHKNANLFKIGVEYYLFRNTKSALSTYVNYWYTKYNPLDKADNTASDVTLDKFNNKIFETGIKFKF